MLYNKNENHNSSLLSAFGSNFADYLASIKYQVKRRFCYKVNVIGRCELTDSNYKQSIHFLRLRLT